MFLAVALIARAPMQLFAEEAVITPELQSAQEKLQEAMHAAEANTKRSMQLENRIRTYDQKVQEAKKHIADLNERKQDVRQQIAGMKELIRALQQQLDALNDERSYHAVRLESQKNEFVDFVRYVSLQNITVSDTGPAVGGAVLHRLLRGSLGDIVEQELHNSAVIRAREDLLGKLESMEQKTAQSQERLQSVAFELSDQLAALETIYHEIDAETNEGLEELGYEERARELSEDELKYIKQSMAEAQARVMELLREKIQVQGKIKDFKVQQSDKRLRELAQKKSDIEREVNDLKDQEKRLQTQKADALAAHDAMTAAKSDDRKLYKRVERLELDLVNMRLRLDFLNQQLSGTGSDNLRAYAIEKEDVERSLPALEDKLVYMRQGYSEEKVEAYLLKRNKSRDANRQIEILGERLKLLNGDISALDQKMQEVKIEYEKAQAMTIDSPFSSGFQWPVKGRITAGFYDPSYYKFYRVEHKAVDIAVPQGSPVYATADGVVHTVKDGGAKGYSFVLIGHSNGYASLYGHMSKMYVGKGEIVEQGQVIGLSGGKPGTAGAGWMTTGPHLHLEIILNGKHINPLSVLGK